MLLKQIVAEDFNNYKVCSMFIAFPTCTWKCGQKFCQNSDLALSQNKSIEYEEIYNQYASNPISKAIVCGGLEPMDSIKDLYMLIVEFRKHGIEDPFIIYTGYNKEEIEEQLDYLKALSNIIVKFGRYKPNQESHFEPLLGVNLSSDNQYAEVIA